MEFKKLSIIVTDPAGNAFYFKVFAHPRKEEEFALVELYKKNTFSETVELEIGNYTEIALKNASLSNSSLHIHKGNDKKQYVCYPPRISNMNEAENIIKIWSIVTAFQMKTGIDSGYLESFGEWVLKKSAIKLNLFEEISKWIIDTLNWKFKIL